MLGVYIFAAVLGGGLLLLSQLGSDHDADGSAGDHGDASDLAAHGPAELVLGFFRPRNLVFLLATFGITGTLLTLTGTAPPLTLGLSIVMGLIAMALTHGVFTWLRRSEVVLDAVEDMDLEGAVCRVVLPVRPGERGRVACLVGDREMHITARLAPGAGQELDSGREAVVLRMIDGEAEVAAFQPPQLPPTIA